MDSITQLQYHLLSTLPLLKEILVDLAEHSSLSVAESHAITQLSEIGFPGVQGVTSHTPPVLVEDLIPFLDRSASSISRSQELFTRFRNMDDIIQSFPAKFESEEEQLAELKSLQDEFEASCQDLAQEEHQLLSKQQQLRELMNHIVQEMCRNVVEQDTIPTYYNLIGLEELNAYLPSPPDSYEADGENGSDHAADSSHHT